VTIPLTGLTSEVNAGESMLESVKNDDQDDEEEKKEDFDNEIAASDFKQEEVSIN
jgi:hypothetical protein